MGHSWGGYQSAFYAVHNHGTFAATIAGAPLTDLISMYGYTSGNCGSRRDRPLRDEPGAHAGSRCGRTRRRTSATRPCSRSIRCTRRCLLEEGDADGNVNPLPEPGALQLRPPAGEERRVSRLRGREPQRRASGEPGGLPAPPARVVRRTTSRASPRRRGSRTARPISRVRRFSRTARAGRMPRCRRAAPFVRMVRRINHGSGHEGTSSVPRWRTSPRCF